MRIVALLAVLLVGGVGTGVWPALAASKNVTMSATAYDPATVSVDVNDDVFWCNPSDQHHDVHADDGSFIKDFPAHSGCSGRTFQTAGTFPYHCTIVTSMHGTVVVGGGSPPPPPPPPPAATSTTARRITTSTVVARPTTTLKRTGTSTSLASSTTVDESTTTTTSRAMALPETRDGGASGGTVAALIATGLMTVAGGAYFVYRLRTRP